MPIPIEEQNIIKILGIETLPDERKVALVEKVSDLVQKRLLLRVWDALPQALQEEFGNLLDKGDQQQALPSFLQKNVPGLDEWIVEEVSKVKKELGDLPKKSA